MGEGSTNKQIGYLLRSYPRLSQTFILNEILALEKIGVSIQIYALTNPYEEVVQRQVDQVHAPIRYLDENAGPRSLRLYRQQPLGMFPSGRAFGVSVHAGRAKNWKRYRSSACTFRA
jgi:hypothetical protein